MPTGKVISLVTSGDLATLALHDGLRFVPLIDPAACNVQELEARAAAKSGIAQPDLAGMMTADAPGASLEDLHALAKALQDLDEVEFASLHASGAPPPADLAPPTPFLVDYQDYRKPNPGMNVEFAVSLGLRGAGIQLSDCEFGWRSAHEDLNEVDLHPEPGHTPAPLGHEDHGTAVAGIIVGMENGYGITGMAPQAEFHTYPEHSVESGYRRIEAVCSAIQNSRPGDIVLLEMQSPGPVDGQGPPAEVDPALWTLVRVGVDAGVVIIAAAGNGNQDLDGDDYQEYRERGDSGAIIVGAGAADESHDKLAFSTYGLRVDVQGWGDQVFTTGYGAIFKYGDDNNQSYRHDFGGTSAASAMVAAAAALVQERAAQLRGEPLSPPKLRAVLKQTGLPQGSGGLIGPFVDLEAALRNLELPNDDFEDRLTLEGSQARVEANTRYATQQQEEPTHSPDGTLGGRSVWWEWIAPASGEVTIETHGSEFDTVLAVYQGVDLATLSPVEQSDSQSNTEHLRFRVAGGSRYQIAIDGHARDGGKIVLSLNFVLGTSNLIIHLADSPDPAPVGGQITYTATVTNLGPDLATNLRLSANLTSNSEFRVRYIDHRCGISNQRLSCHIDSLQPGSNVEIFFAIETTAVGIVTSEANIQSSESDPNSPGSSASQITVINEPTDLAVSIHPLTHPARAGSALSYAVSVTNGGPTTAPNAYTRSIFSEQHRFASSKPAGMCFLLHEFLHCTLGSIPANGRIDFEITIVPANGEGSITHDIEAASEKGDQNLTNNKTSSITPLAGSYVAGYKNIADTRTEVPNGTGFFTYFGPPTLDRGRVFFLGVDSSNVEGLYLYEPAQGLVEVIDGNDLKPESSLSFQHFHDISLDGLSLSFQNLENHQGQDYATWGIFRRASGNIELIADTHTRIPGRNVTFNQFTGLTIDDGEVSFSGANYSHGIIGVFRSLDHNILPVAYSGDQVPGSTHTFEDFGPTVAKAGNIAFYATASDNKFNGIYKTNNQGTLHKVADQISLQRIRPDFGFDGQVIAFAAEKDGIKGLFTDQDGLRVVATNNDYAPGSTRKFTGFSSPSVDDGKIAFLGVFDTGAIMVETTGHLLRVIDQKYSYIEGERVTNFDIWHNRYFSDEQVAFTAHFLERKGIYVATIASHLPPTVQIIEPNSNTYKMGEELTVRWRSNECNASDPLTLSVRRDSATNLSEPDGINWAILKQGTPNDGSELVLIPTGLAPADDWRFYVLHTASGAYDATDFKFSIATSPQPQCSDGGGLCFFTVTPCRLIDTRLPEQGPELISGVARVFPVNGACGIPSSARALSVNVTAVNASGLGHLRLYPGDLAQPPSTSSINFATGQNRANNTVLPLAVDGSGTLSVYPFIVGAGQVHFILDVNGYFE